METTTGNAQNRVRLAYELDSHGNRKRVTDLVAGVTYDYFYEGQYVGNDVWDNETLAKSSSRLLKIIDPPLSGGGTTPPGQDVSLQQHLRNLLRKIHQALDKACAGKGDNQALYSQVALLIRRFRQENQLRGVRFRELIFGLPGMRDHLLALLDLPTPQEKIQYGCTTFKDYLGTLVANLGTGNSANSGRHKSSGGNPIAETDFAYDAAGSLVSEADLCYRYDASSRLVAIGEKRDLELGCDPSNVAEAVWYRYDWRGRRVFKSIFGVFNTYYIYDQADRLIAEYGVAVAADLTTVTGGPTREYVYLGDRPIAMVNAGEMEAQAGDIPDLSQLCNGGGIGQCRVAAAGAKAKNKRTGLLGYLFIPLIFLLAGTWRWVRSPRLRRAVSYLAVLGLCVSAATTVDCGATYVANTQRPIYFIHQDLGRRPALLTDESGQHVWYAVYDAFGNVVPDLASDDADGDGQPVSIALRAPGQYWDSEGDYLGGAVHYNWFRYYHTETGRYNRVEPLHAVAHQLVRHPAGGVVNPYTYVLHNPVVNIDRNGLATDSCSKSEICMSIAMTGVAAGDKVMRTARRGIQAIARSGPARAASHQLNRARQCAANAWNRAGASIKDIFSRVAGAPGASTNMQAAGSSAVSNVPRIVQSAPQGFRTFDAFKYWMGPAGKNLNWHHIVEQTTSNIRRFGPETIHNLSNVMRLDAATNSRLNALYSSIRPLITGSQTLTVRQWLNTQAFNTQQQFGLRALTNIASGVW